jgi:hypothetical protein
MSAFADFEIFSDRNAAQVRATSYAMGANRRSNVHVIEASRVLLHESTGGPQATRRIHDSGQGTYFVVVSEG